MLQNAVVPAQKPKEGIQSQSPSFLLWQTWSLITDFNLTVSPHVLTLLFKDIPNSLVGSPRYKGFFESVVNVENSNLEFQQKL